jgi:hypothetical protein
VGRITPVEAGRLRAEEEHIEHRLHEMQDHHDGCWCS